MTAAPLSTTRQIIDLSTWINTSYPAGLCAEAIDRRRIDKCGEELGEVIAAYGGFVGENPRKGVINGLDKVLYELLDLATCALGAYAHLAGDHIDVSLALYEHVDLVHHRAGLS